MKNTTKPKSESIFKKKGFYVALYASLGVMVVAAAVISMKSFDATAKKEPAPVEQAVDLSQYAETNQSNVESYRASQAQGQAETKQEDIQVKLGDPKATSVPIATTQPSANREEKVPEPPKAVVTESPTSQATEAPLTRAPETPVADLPKTEPNEQAEDSVISQETEAQALENDTVASEPADSTGELGDPVFNAYTEDNKMDWPVFGEIVMNYSMDRTTYDKTLHQYRTNDNICIAAPVGTPVKASAEGVVVKIDNTETKGNEVVIDNGNGWTTTYSQLQDGVLVNVGDIVRVGQVLGGIGDPSRYGVLLGNHLSFKVTKDDRLVDPVSILAQ